MGNAAGDKSTPTQGRPDLPLTTRRRFLDYLLGTSAAATLGAIFYPIIRFMAPPHVVEAMQSSVVAAKVSEMPPK